MTGHNLFQRYGSHEGTHHNVFFFFFYGELCKINPYISMLPVLSRALLNGK